MVSIRYQSLLGCVGCALVLVWWVMTRIEIHILNWFVAVCLFLMVCVLADIYRLDPSSYHTYKSLIHHYLIYKFYHIIGYVGITRFRKVCQNVESAQAIVLRSLLKNASNSAFAIDHGLASVRNVEDFRKTIPLTTYDDYLPYVNRVLNGEDNVLFCAKADYIALTSGTTSSKSKAYPKSVKLANRNIVNTVSFLLWSIYTIPGLEKLRLFVLSGCPTRSRVNEQGFTIGPASAASNMTSFPYWSTPKTATEITNEEHKAYVDLVFGLRDKEVSAIYSLVAPTTVMMFTTLEKYWRHLCDDIERGTLYSGIPLSTGMRYELERLCRPDPVRAAELRREFTKGFDGIVPRIWPHCKAILAISSGTFQVYGDILKKKYMGNITLFSQCHAATEGILGINLWPELSDVHYAPTAGAYFYEWLAVDDDDSTEPVLLHQVELGRQYEMVITTFDGLYRYRTGDIVEFTKYYFQLPVYKFVRRSGDFLNLLTEKIPEISVSVVLRKIFTEYKQVTLVDYTCTESTYYEKFSGGLDGGLYHVIFAEIDGNITDLDNIIKKVDNELCSLNDDYRRFRSQESIRTIQLIPLRSGAFQRFKVKRMSANPDTSSMQYKVPRVIRSEDFVQFFLDERLDH